jgi:hypothetical protein
VAGLGAADDECAIVPTWQASAQVAETITSVAMRVLAKQAMSPENGTPCVQLDQELFSWSRTFNKVELKLDDAFAVCCRHACWSACEIDGNDARRNLLDVGHDFLVFGMGLVALHSVKVVETGDQAEVVRPFGVHNIGTEAEFANLLDLFRQTGQAVGKALNVSR